MTPTTPRFRTVDLLKRGLKAALGSFNLTITRSYPYRTCTSEWIEAAQGEGMAVNDFVERSQGKPAQSELEKLVFPLISSQSVVCELGPGTGVYTRYISQVITLGEFHVVDADPSAIAFLGKHLPPNPALRLYRNSGTELPFEASNWVDLVFCASMFTGCNLSYLFRYMQECHRVLKPGGVCVFDYFDIATEAGWNVLLSNMARRKPVFNYSYHTTQTVDRVIAELGFGPAERFPTVRGSVFITARKR